MQVSLRRAAQIHSDIEKFFATLPALPVTISVYETDINAAINTKRQEILDALAIRDDLESILFDLRTQIGRKNVESGINDLLAEQARLESRRRRLEKFVASKPVQADLVRGKIATARERATKVEQAGYFNKSALIEEIASDVLNDSDITQLKSELTETKRQLRDIAGTLIDLNSKTTAELSETAAGILQKHGIL